MCNKKRNWCGYKKTTKTKPNQPKKNKQKQKKKKKKQNKKKQKYHTMGAEFEVVRVGVVFNT